MTQKNKELLLKDLCSRLSYQVKVSVNDGKEPWTLKGIFESEYTGMMLILEPSFPSKDVYPPTSNWPLSQCKPYLRPMSSMTEEEHNEWFNHYHEIELKEAKSTGDYLKSAILGESASIDWLNKNMFDFRGLIPAGRAISTEEFNPYKD